MAAPTQVLKSNTFLTLDEVKEHLRIPLTNNTLDNQVIRLINMATNAAEKYVDGPLLTREIVEVRDGDGSNTIVPDHYPVRSIKEVRIDYAGDFTPPSTIITPDQFLIRGASDLEIGIRGTDIAIRNDGNTTIIGRLFIGSVVGSIQLTYRAGWGETPDTMPDDIKYAVLMAIEYFYILRENRELGIKSKSNTGQSYSREFGLPVEVQEMLDPYKDTTLGRANRPQKNNFVI